MERKKNARRITADKCYARWAAFKESCQSNLFEQLNGYTEGFTMSRNSILKKSIL